MRYSTAQQVAQQNKQKPTNRYQPLGSKQARNGARIPLLYSLSACTPTATTATRRRLTCKEFWSLATSFSSCRNLAASASTADASTFPGLLPSVADIYFAVVDAITKLASTAERTTEYDGGGRASERGRLKIRALSLSCIALVLFCAREAAKDAQQRREGRERGHGEWPPQFRRKRGLHFSRAQKSRDLTVTVRSGLHASPPEQAEK